MRICERQMKGWGDPFANETSSICCAVIALFALRTAPRENGENQFENWHARREAENPLGVTMALDTADGKRTYPESEYIPLVIKYSSNISGKYKIAITNAAANNQRLHADGIQSLSYSAGFPFRSDFPAVGFTRLRLYS